MEQSNKTSTDIQLRSNFTLERYASIFFLCSDIESDLLWTKDCAKYLREAGIKNLNTSFELRIGYREYDELEIQLKTVNKLAIVLSQQSLNVSKFKKMMQCAILFVQEENETCCIIPILLTEQTVLPLILRETVPFYAWRDEITKLLKAILLTNENHLLKTYVYNLSQLSNTGQYLRNLNKCILPPNVSTLEKQLASNVLEWWGMMVSDARFSIDMRKMQIISRDQRPLINDLFNSIFSSDKIKIIRITGLTNFHYEDFRRDRNLFDELVDIYLDHFKTVTHDFRLKYWYHYKRHHVRNSDRTLDISGPLLKCFSLIAHENIHYPKMEALEARENSLKTFPLKSSTFRSKLADAGFFYFDYIDYVQCFCCGGCLRTWSIDDDPLERHIERFPYCSFHVDIIKSSTEETIHGSMHPFIDETPHSETSEEMFEDKLIQKYDRNYYRENFSDVANRRLTFEKFKTITDVEIDESIFQQYAEAGFFYYGVKEDVVCFSCTLGLAEISKDINPWALHLQFAPTCIYVTSNMDKFKGTVTDTSIDATDPYIEFELNMH